METSNQPQASQTPPEELVVKQCWSPPCPNVAAFRDGAGWWWCILHQDRQMWGIDKILNYQEVVQKCRELKGETK